jgi:hypothetical protein
MPLGKRGVLGWTDGVAPGDGVVSHAARPSSPGLTRALRNLRSGLRLPTDPTDGSMEDRGRYGSPNGRIHRRVPRRWHVRRDPARRRRLAAGRDHRRGCSGGLGARDVETETRRAINPAVAERGQVGTSLASGGVIGGRASRSSQVRPGSPVEQFTYVASASERIRTSDLDSIRKPLAAVAQ